MTEGSNTPGQKKDAGIGVIVISQHTAVASRPDIPEM